MNKLFQKWMYSIKSRLVFSMVILAVFSLLIIVIVSYRALSSIAQTRLQPSVLTDVQQLSDQMWKEYLTLVHISQLMMPQGYVGVSTQDYLKAATHYDRMVFSKMVSENLTLVTFSNPQIEMAMYYSQTETGTTPFFSTNAVDIVLDLRQLPTLIEASEITYQTFHESQSYANNNQVLSLTRQVEFEDGIRRGIYVETRSGIPDYIQLLSESQGIPYYFLQLSEEGGVVYSTLDAYPVGSHLNLVSDVSTPDIGRTDGYIWVRAQSPPGYFNVLLLPQDKYNRERNAWLFEIVFATLVVLVMVVILAMSLRRIYKPFRVLEREMHRFGGGDMSAQDYTFGIKEFDSLFQQYELLKEQIQELMDNIRYKEKEKRQLELDKLYYQINPHFLMNALNSAQWMATINDQLEIAQYLTRLNYLLSYTLSKTAANTTLRSEIQVMTAYLELQQFRHDFQMHIDVEPGLYLDRPCARMILQPVVENAVCHSLDDFGAISVTIRQQDFQVVVIIEDDGIGFKPENLSFRDEPNPGTERETHPGIGLRYVWLTLDAFYEGRASMEIDSAPGKGTQVTLRFPCADNKGVTS